MNYGDTEEEIDSRLSCVLGLGSFLCLVSMFLSVLCVSVVELQTVLQLCTRLQQTLLRPDLLQKLIITAM